MAPGLGKSTYYILYIDPTADEKAVRTIALNSPKSTEFILETPEIQPNQVLYYTVTLPDEFPTLLTAEYISTKTSMHGVRLSYGARFGGYLCYKWGKYFKAGTSIEEYGVDTDLSHAAELGYIRSSYTAGARIGIINKLLPVYAFVGGGYGEYGRQWQNLTEVDNNIYFYSDYIKGFEGELGVTCVCYDVLTLSVGANALFGKGKVMTELQLGIGLSLDQSKVFKRKKKKVL